MEVGTKTALLAGFSVGLIMAMALAAMTVGQQRDELKAQLAARPCDMDCYTRAEAQAWISVYQHQCNNKPDLEVATFRTFDEALTAEKALGCFRSADYSKKGETAITFDTKGNVYGYYSASPASGLTLEWNKGWMTPSCYFDASGGVTCPSGHDGTDSATCTDSKNCKDRP